MTPQVKSKLHPLTLSLVASGSTNASSTSPNPAGELLSKP